MSSFKDQMIESFERGECGYYESYDYVRERMADQADLLRKQRKENPEPPATDPRPDPRTHPEYWTE